MLISDCSQSALTRSKSQQLSGRAGRYEQFYQDWTEVSRGGKKNQASAEDPKVVQFPLAVSEEKPTRKEAKLADANRVR